MNTLNTKFKKRKGKLWTYSYPNNAKAQIDYILINKKGINTALKCETYPSFEGVSSDHRNVPAKIRLRLRRNVAQTTRRARCDWSLLNNNIISNKYTITLRNTFDARQEISETSTPKDEHRNFVNVHIQAAAECIPTKLRTKHRVP